MPKTHVDRITIAMAIFALALLAGVVPAVAAVIPADRTTLWNPGIPGGVPSRTTVCETVTAPSGDAYSAIQGAINACPVGQVVQLAAGTYNLGGSPLSITKGITLRGAGATKTILKKTAGTGSAVVAIGSPFPSYKSSTNLTSSAVKEASSVTVASTSGLSVGQLVLIDKTNETGVTYNAPDCDSNCQGWFARSGRQLSQMMEISAINGNTVTFSTPFHVTFDTSHSAQLTTFNSAAVKNAGLEDLKVYGGEGADSGGNIYMEMAAYSWVARVESAWSRGGSIHIYHGLRNVVRDSYFHESPNNDPGGEGYGITVDKASADNLIENNISWAFNKVMLMRSAGGGNVIAYNYFEDGYGNSYKNYVETGANATHMTTSHFELFEGNESFNIGAETRWGGADHITFFRNHVTGIRRSLGGLGLTDGNRLFAAVKARNYYYTFVGNVLGSAGMSPSPGGSSFTYEYTSNYKDNPIAMWRLGEPDSGGTPGISGSGDPQVAATLLREGNFDYATNSVHWGAGGAQTIPNSLYLTSKPAFFGSNPWPWVDPIGATKVFTLPARFRFDNPGATQSSTLGISDASVTEGNSSTKLANFVVMLAPAATGSVTVNYATANGTATAGSDYVAQSGTLTFTAGQTSKTIAVVVNGDTLAEPNETFVVNLSSASGATIADGQGIGTIVSDDVLPTMSINDVSVSEGNSGTKAAIFTVSLSTASTATVTATYATANGTATAGSDYVATAGTVTFPAGTTTKTITVTVNGNTTVEPNETFFVNLSAAVGATIADAQGTATIVNDDGSQPMLSIADVSVAEGSSGTKAANFVVTLSPAASSTVTVHYATANGTATAGSDYVAQSGTLTFAAGQTSKTIAVLVNGNTTVEPNEAFTVSLTSPVGAGLSRAQAVGTVTNDDGAPTSGPPGLVAGYRFAEGTGTSTVDLTGHGITGTLMSGPTWTTGQYGGALGFNGTSFVNLGNPTSLQLTGSMTLSAWIRISSNPGDDGSIVAKLGPAGWQLKTSPDTGVRTAAIQISSNGWDSIQRYSRTVLATNTWYHLAGVFDPSTRSLNIYVNGVLDNGVLKGTVPASQANAPQNVNIAQRTGYPGSFNFRGTIDEVHVFNRALNGTEVQSDMSTPRVGP